MSEIRLDGFDLGAALGIQPEPPKPERPKFVKGKTRDIKVSHRMSKRPMERKAQSEKSLEDAIHRWSFREGDSYHCFTFGDVDFMTFVKFILRQQYAPYIAVSSWVISGEDILDLQEWQRRGLIGRIDLFLGEIFERSYPDAYKVARELISQCGGRLCIIRNHSKLVAIQGERFNALIESSANMNTNPRSENAVVTVDRRLVEDCIDFLAGIQPFNRNNCGAPPYRIQRK